MGQEVTYSETLPEKRSKYVVVTGRAVFFCFDVNKSAVLGDHVNYIRDSALPFIERALKRLGPGTYDLNIIGSASATGSHDGNMDLSAARAGGIAREIIRQFEADKKRDPKLAVYDLQPAVSSNGDEEAEKDPLLSGARKKGRPMVEQVQAIYRSAVFRFSAGQDNKSATFQIREIYFFKFEKMEEDLPQVVKDIQKFFDQHKVIKFFGEQLIDKLMKPVWEALGSLGSIAKHMVTFMVPKQVDYCFEIKDSLKDHALYRFNGAEQSDSLGILDAIGFVTKVMGMISALEKVAKDLGAASKDVGKILGLLKKASEVSDELIAKLMPIVEKTFGREVAQAIKQGFLQLRSGLRLAFSAISVPGSDWHPFRYHDGQADHDIKQLDKPARREAIQIAFKSRVDISFGGSASTQSWAWMAQASIFSFSIIRNAFFSPAKADGVFIPLQLGYLNDISPGLFDPVTG